MTDWIEFVKGITRKDNIDLRGVCTLYDQKKAMLYRLKEFEKQKYIPSYLVEDYQKIVQLSQQSINLVIKRNITRNDFNIVKLIELMQKIRDN